MTSPPTNQKNVHELITPSSLNPYYKTSHYSFQVRTHSLGFFVCFVFLMFILFGYARSYFATCRIFGCGMKMKVKVKSLSYVRLFATPLTVACQDPPSMGFSRQEYWSGLPFPSPGDTGVGCHFLHQEIFPTQELNPCPPHCRQMVYRLSHQGSPSCGMQTLNCDMWDLVP